MVNLARRSLGVGVAAVALAACTDGASTDGASTHGASTGGSSQRASSPSPTSPASPPGSSASPGSSTSPGSSASPASSASTPTTASSSEDRAAVGQIIVAGLQAPWSIAFVDSTALISERDSGQILELVGVQKSRVVGTVAGVNGRGEGGLLGLAVRGRDLYAYYTAGSVNRVVKMALQGEPGALRLGPQTVVVEGIPSATNHNGGRLCFGPDGMLYIATGDANNPEAAQDIDTLGGKILRVTPDGKVPDDNPFRTSMVFSYGHRNVQGLAFFEGKLYASELGQNTLDEFNLIVAGGNYGWPQLEGRNASGAPAPLLTWPTEQGSPSGIAIVRGRAYIANLAGRRVKEVPLDDPGGARDLAVNRYGRIRDCVLTPQGEVWLLTNNTDGRGDPEAGDDRIIVIA